MVGWRRENKDNYFPQVHKSITTLQGEDIVFLATDINLPGVCLKRILDILNVVHFQVLWTG